MDHALLDRRELLKLLCAAAGCALTGHARAREDALCVIVANTSKQPGLDLFTLRRVFLNQPTDDAGGHRFIPFNAAARSDDRMAFDARVLGMDADAVARHWIDQRIRGVQSPRTSTTPDMTVRLVAKLPGSIAYVRERHLIPQVKVLRIDGKLPSDDGYLFAGST